MDQCQWPRCTHAKNASGWCLAHEVAVRRSEKAHQEWTAAKDAEAWRILLNAAAVSKT